MWLLPLIHSHLAVTSENSCRVHPKWSNFSATLCQTQRLGVAALDVPGAHRAGGKKHKNTSVKQNWPSDETGPEAPWLSSCIKLAKSREFLYNILEEATLRRQVRISSLPLQLYGKTWAQNRLCSFWREHTQPQVFQEAQQAAVAKPLPSRRLLNATKWKSTWWDQAEPTKILFPFFTPRAASALPT